MKYRNFVGKAEKHRLQAFAGKKEDPVWIFPHAGNDIIRKHVYVKANAERKMILDSGVKNAEILWTLSFRQFKGGEHRFVLS